MEILMKLKCSPTTPGNVPSSSPRSTIKVVDHLQPLNHRHQLQQQQPLALVAPPPTTPTHMRSDLQLHPSSLHQQRQQPASLPRNAHPAQSITPQKVMLPTCMEFECCSAASVAVAQPNIQRRCAVSASNHAPTNNRNIVNPQRHYTAGGGNMYGNEDGRSYCNSAAGACNIMPCCSGLPSYGMAMPATGAHHQLETFSHHILQQPITDTQLNMSATSVALEDCNTHYEYHEPEENFVSIDDAKIKGFLMKIGQEKEEKLQEEETMQQQCGIQASPNCAASVVYEIIELDDESEREKLKRIKNEVIEIQSRSLSLPQPQMRVRTRPVNNHLKHRTKSPSISLIPKSPELQSAQKLPERQCASKEKIIAKIELLDSSDSEGNDNDDRDDDDELPFAAAAVSCELECDDDNDNGDAGADNSHYINNNAKGDTTDVTVATSGDVVVLASDDENVEFIDEHEEGLELRWDDFEEQKERTFFECFLCGKKVQSSYNLRRHMMIHTGERPFGCDMCDRRFREFSDLKKHRRRHANETNFVCMVCRINTPTDNDPTRCSACDTRNGAQIAASRSQAPPATSTSPEKSLSPSHITMKRRLSALPPSHNLTPASSAEIVSTSPPPPPPSSQYCSKSNSIATAIMTSTSSVPPPTPVKAITDTQMLLDSIPAVHRPSYNQLGVITRKEFPCPLCQRPFGTRHNLKRHFMIHTGEKPFSCANCRKPFREYSTLKKHMITHQRDRWYKCLRCPQKYRDYLDYIEHKNVHGNDEHHQQMSGGSSSNTPTPRKRFKLKHGGTSYDDYGYDSNDDDSSNEDWLECCECAHRFTDLEAYTEHIKEHDPNMFLYQCYICKSTFEECDKLVSHISEHHAIDADNDSDDVLSSKAKRRKGRWLDNRNIEDNAGNYDDNGDNDNDNVANGEDDFKECHLN